MSDGSTELNSLQIIQITLEIMYLKRLLVLLFYFDVSTTSDYTEDNVVLVLRSLISEKELWKQMITQREILIDRKFQTIYAYFEDEINNDNVDRHGDISYIVDYIDVSNVRKVSNMMYTALKCEYAYSFGHILQFFFRCVSACRSGSKRYNQTNDVDSDDEETEQEEQYDCVHVILTRFLALKPYFVRAILNLFNFKGLSNNLKSSDQTLSVTLMSINLFIYTNLSKTKPTILDVFLRKIFLQMVNLVDNFKSKNCSMVFDFTQDYTIIMNKIHNYFQASKDEFNKYFRSESDFILKTYLTTLNHLEDIGLECSEYSINMYDPEYIMLNNNDFGSKYNNLSIKFSSEVISKRINDILLDIQPIYDIKNVFKYQMLIINYIKNLFLLKFANVMNTQISIENKLGKLKTLLHYFEEYLDYFIPDNYPQAYFQPINKIITTLNISLDYPNSKDEVYFKSFMKMASQFKKDSIIDRTTDNFNSIFMNISMLDLIEDIKKYSKPFVQTFDLLLQESNTLDDYYLFQKEDYRRLIKKNNSNKNTVMCQVMENVRNSLVWLWSLIDVILRESVEQLKDRIDDILITFFLRIVKYIEYLHQNVITDKQIKNLLLPLIINRKNIFNVEYNDSHSAIFTFKQIIIMTVTSIQNHEIINCKSDKSQRLIEDVLITNTHTIVQLSTDLTVLSSYISGVLSTFILVNDEISNINFSTDYYTLNHILNNSGSDSNEIYSEQIQFYWNGNKTNIYNICQDIKVNVSDYHDLVRFQSFVLKWFLSKAYTKMLYIFKFPISLTQDKIDLIRNDFNQFQTHISSSTLMTYVQDTIQLFLEIFKNKDISYKAIINFDKAVSYHLKFYGVFIGTHPYTTFDDCYRSLKSDFEAMVKHFSRVDDKLLIYNDDFSKPMFWH